MTLNEAIDIYLPDFKERAALCSYHNYRKRLKPFRLALGNLPLTEITAAQVIELINSINRWPDGTSKAPDTIRGNIMGWEQLQIWMIDNDILHSPITTKKLKKPGGRKREVLPTAEETRQILAHGQPDFRLIYRSLRLTGARPGELCKAMISNIEPVEGLIILHEHKTARKTGKPRRIAIGHPTLIELIRESIGDRKEGNIFLRKNGRPWRTELVSAAFRKARDEAGLRKCLVLYLARHEHGHALYTETKDIKCVADSLGHANISTTMRYTRVEASILKKSQMLFKENLE